MGSVLSVPQGVDEAQERFSNVPARIASMSFGLFLVVLGIVGMWAVATRGESGVASVSVLVFGGAAFALRGNVASTVTVGKGHVVLRSFLQTRSIDLKSIGAVSTAVGRTGFGASRRHLVIELRSGEQVLFKELNVSVSQAKSNELDRAVVSIRAAAPAG